jgi:two-component system sensor histidine kinase DesK
VSILLTHRADRIVLNIGDNGDCKQIEPGNGIEGMKDRVAELKGQLSYSIEQGVKLSVEVPFGSMN